MKHLHSGIDRLIDALGDASSMTDDELDEEIRNLGYDVTDVMDWFGERVKYHADQARKRWITEASAELEEEQAYLQEDDEEEEARPTTREGWQSWVKNFASNYPEASVNFHKLKTATDDDWNDLWEKARQLQRLKKKRGA